MLEHTGDKILHLQDEASKTHTELKRRFSRLPIISVNGVRREESPQRARAAIFDHKPGERIWTWRPILGWPEAEVFSSLNF